MSGSSDTISRTPSSPHPGAIEETVLDGLTHEMGTQVAGPLQIGNGPGDFEHTIVCPRRKRQARHRLSKNPGGRVVQRAPTPDLSGSHVAVRPHPGRKTEPLMLALTSSRDTGSNDLARLRGTDRA